MWLPFLELLLGFDKIFLDRINDGLELDMEQQIGSKSGKEYDKAECHPAYLTYMKNTS